MKDAPRIRRRRWTPVEDDILRGIYGQLSAAETGELIGRTEDAVWLRARTLGLDKREEVRPWTHAELHDLRASYATELASVIARRLGRTTSAVSQRAKCLGVVSHKATITTSTIHGYFGTVATAEQAYILGLLGGRRERGQHSPSNQPWPSSQRRSPGRHRPRPALPCCGPVAERGWVQPYSRSRPGRLVADLAPYGIAPRKSHTLPWPHSLGDLRRPFLLGSLTGTAARICRVTGAVGSGPAGHCALGRSGS